MNQDALKVKDNFSYRFPDVPHELQEENGIQYRFEVYESIQEWWGNAEIKKVDVICKWSPLCKCWTYCLEQTAENKNKPVLSSTGIDPPHFTGVMEVMLGLDLVWFEFVQFCFLQVMNDLRKGRGM